MYEWRTGRACIYKNHVHLVSVTKYRRITQEMLDRLKEIFIETCLQMDCELLEFSGEDDHVHLMVAVHPKVAIANLVGKLKRKSSFIFRREFWKQIKSKLWGVHFWSPSYCAVSCKGASLDMIKSYIENQRKPPSEAQIRQSKAISINRRA